MALFCSGCGAENSNTSSFCLACGRAVTQTKADEIPRIGEDRLALASGATLEGERYRIERELGAGGMGTVYLAWDADLSRNVVIKIPHLSMLQDPQFAGRFSDEIRSQIYLSHHGVIHVYGRGVEEGVPYVVMQYADGGSLKDRLATGAIADPLDLLNWLPQIADALDFLHAQDFVHRDVKPDNILFDAHGGVYVSDFGIGKALADSEIAPDTQTKTGVFIGTPAYLPPEYVDREFTPACDQYSLAVVVYRVLSGRFPHEAETAERLFIDKSTVAPRMLSDLRPDLSQKFVNTVMRALSMSPEDRFPTCTDFADQIAEAVGESEAREPAGDTVLWNSPSSVRRSSWIRWGAALVAVAVFLVLGGRALYRIQSRGAEPVDLATVEVLGASASDLFRASIRIKPRLDSSRLEDAEIAIEGADVSFLRAGGHAADGEVERARELLPQITREYERACSLMDAGGLESRARSAVNQFHTHLGFLEGAMSAPQPPPSWSSLLKSRAALAGTAKSDSPCAVAHWHLFQLTTVIESSQAISDLDVILKRRESSRATARTDSGAGLPTSKRDAPGGDSRVASSSSIEPNESSRLLPKDRPSTGANRIPNLAATPAIRDEGRLAPARPSGRADDEARRRARRDLGAARNKEFEARDYAKAHSVWDCPELHGSARSHCEEGREEMDLGVGTFNLDSAGQSSEHFTLASAAFLRAAGEMETIAAAERAAAGIPADELSIEDQVRAVMEAYETAYDTRDLQALEEVWPLSENQRRGMDLFFSDTKSIKSIEMTLELGEIVPDGEGAWVDFFQTVVSPGLPSPRRKMRATIIRGAEARLVIAKIEPV